MTQRIIQSQAVASGWADQLRWKIGGTALEFPLRRVGHVVLRRQLRPPIGFDYDRSLVKVMRRVLHGGGAAIDVGAHDGALLRWMVRFAPHDRHLAIEPLPAYAARLRQRFPSVDIEAVAVADRAGTAQFHFVPDRPAISSFAVRDGIAPADCVPFEVPVTTIDTLTADRPPVRFIKIDVEGAEYQVLEGARETIRRDWPIIGFEHGPGAHGGITVRDMHKLLTQDLALRVSLIDTWLAGRPPLSEAEMIAAQQHQKHFFFLAHP